MALLVEAQALQVLDHTPVKQLMSNSHDNVRRSPLTLERGFKKWIHCAYSRPSSSPTESAASDHAYAEGVEPGQEFISSKVDAPHTKNRDNVESAKTSQERRVPTPTLGINLRRATNRHKGKSQGASDCFV